MFRLKIKEKFGVYIMLINKMMTYSYWRGKKN